MASYALASPSGMTFAFYFFITFSGVVALAIYRLLTHVSSRRVKLGAGALRKPPAALLAVVVWIGLFGAIYLTTLDGFHTITLGERSLRMEFGGPRPRVELRISEIRRVAVLPAFRNLWRLEIHTVADAGYESALASSAAVREVAAALERQR